MPFFSVILPTYNRANFIVSTIQSILNQSFVDFELIVVDDGSTDETPQLMEENFAHNAQLKYFRKKNEERSIARNFGLQKAQGKYAVFFDSDDFMHANHLEILHHKIVQLPEVKCLATKYQTEGQGNSETYAFPEGFYDYNFLLTGNSLGVLICLKIDPMPAFLFHPDFNMCEDWIFNIQNLKNEKIYLIDELTITVSGHDGRSLANNEKAITGRIRAMNYLLDNVKFTKNERIILQGHSYRFCAIHAYLDGNQKQALQFWKKMLQFLEFQPSFLVLLAKIFVGKKKIAYIQKLLKM